MKYDCISFVPQALNELKKDETTGKSYDQAEVLAVQVNKVLNLGLINSITKTRAHSMQGSIITRTQECS